MEALFACTRNTRPLLPDSLRFWRSDAPTTVSEAERRKRPCPLWGDPAFLCQSMPVTGGSAVPASPEEVAASYIRMADERLEALADALLRAETNVLYFCSAGKDRSGVLSAVLLYRLGYDRRFILDDYLLSGERLRAELEAYAAAHPEVDPRVIRPQRRYMADFLDWYAAAHPRP